MQEEKEIHGSNHQKRKSFTKKRKSSIIKKTEDMLKRKKDRIKQCEKKKTEKDQAEQRKCTFRPKINKKFYKSKFKKKRTIGDLYKWQRKKINKRYQESLRRNKTPTKKLISRNSEKLISVSSRKRNTVKIEERLLMLERKKQARLAQMREEKFEELMNTSGRKNHTSIRDKASFKKSVKSKSFVTLPKKKNLLKN